MLNAIRYVDFSDKLISKLSHKRKEISQRLGHFSMTKDKNSDKNCLWSSKIRRSLDKSFSLTYIVNLVIDIVTLKGSVVHHLQTQRRGLNILNIGWRFVVPRFILL